ncbi:hypothetical protein HYV82_00505 [Candidatus Woesearchaeota archaeon]|nr:hypothetical protein [Candidatus Woesearchaeota archaeon]
MMVKGKILKWGNSLGLRLDKSAALRSGLLPNEEVEVEVKRKVTTGRDIFGKLERRVDTAKALREIDELFED